MTRSSRGRRGQLEWRVSGCRPRPLLCTTERGDRMQIMTQTLTRPDRAHEHGVSAADLRRLEEEPGLEYSEGEFLEKQVSRESSRIAIEIAYRFRASAGAPPTVEIYGPDLGYRCHPDDPDWFRKPDVSVIRKERLSGLGDVGMMPIPADLAVEVISPRDLARDVLEKVEQYLEARFPLVWLVSAERRLVDVYRADGSITRLHENDPIDAGEAVPEFQGRVGDLFV